MDSLKLLVAVYKLGFECGVFTIEEVIKFCDIIIENLENPPFEIIEASLMSHSNVEDLANKLGEYNRELDEEYVVQIILAVICKKYIKNEFCIKDAIKCTYKLLVDTNLYFQDDYYDLYCLDDSYELAVNNVYGDINEVENEFMNVIKRYEVYYRKFVDSINLGKDFRNKKFIGE